MTEAASRPPDPPASVSAHLAGTRIGVVGTGMMAQAIISGLLRRDLVSSKQVICSHPRGERRKQLRSELGVTVTGDNAEVARGADLVLLAVKPQILPRVMPELGPELRADAVVLSIVAGASSGILRQGLDHPEIVRAMPNTPAQIGAGITVWYCTPPVSAPAKQMARLLLSALGEEVEVEDERQVAMATAVSGTGPTYTFLFIESLVDAAVHLGFPRQIARRLALSTVAGATAFASESSKHVSELRNMVTSPGGTSAEALAALERGGFRTVLGDAVWAAYRRTLELESELRDRVDSGGQD